MTDDHDLAPSRRVAFGLNADPVVPELDAIAPVAAPGSEPARASARRFEPTIDPSSLWQGMPEALAREGRGLARLRNLSTPWRTGLAFVGLVALALLVWTLYGRLDQQALPRAEFWLRWLPGAVLAVASARALLWPAHRRAPPAWLPQALLLAAVGLALAPALLPELHRSHPASLPGAGGDLVERALPCVAIGLAFGATCVAWVALFVQERRGLRALPLSAWALFVIGQGTLSALHCPLTAPLHLAFGHGSLGIIVLAALAARRARGVGQT